MYSFTSVQHDVTEALGRGDIDGAWEVVHDYAHDMDQAEHDALVAPISEAEAKVNA